MKITKLEHSGIAFEQSGKTLLCDPVEIQAKLPVFNNVVAIIITHEHGDHFQPEVVARILSQNPNAQIFTTADNSENLPQATIASAGDEFTIENFRLKFFGKDHAPILDGQVPCQNLGVVIDDQIVNPSDSFDSPNLPSPEVLFVALSAPWCKIQEILNYIATIKPQKVIPIHDAVLSDFGKQVNNNWIQNFCEESNIEFHALSLGQHLETTQG